jgi:hypothetical protein
MPKSPISSTGVAHTEYGSAPLTCSPGSSFR